MVFIKSVDNLFATKNIKMFLKKFIHYTFLNLKIHKYNIPFYLVILNVGYPILFIPSTLILYNQNASYFSDSTKYDDVYNIKCLIKTKHLFLFTVYILYSKLSKIINLYYFKFQFLITKQKKFTVLRAPCNHKNSKEQFGVTTYRSMFTFQFPFITNKFYTSYIISFFFKEKKLGLFLLKNSMKQHASKLYK